MSLRKLLCSGPSPVANTWSGLFNYKGSDNLRISLQLIQSPILDNYMSIMNHSIMECYNVCLSAPNDVGAGVDSVA